MNNVTVKPPIDSKDSASRIAQGAINPQPTIGTNPINIEKDTQADLTPRQTLALESLARKFRTVN